MVMDEWMDGVSVPGGIKCDVFVSYNSLTVKSLHSGLSCKVQRRRKLQH